MVRIVPMELETHFADGKVNAFLAIGDTVTLIDTGNPGPEAFQQLKTKLHKHGIGLKDIDQIVLTHNHIDHAGAIPYIQNEVDIPIFVHERAKGSINMSLETFESNREFMHQFMKECGADPLTHIIQREYKQENWSNVSYLQDGWQILLGGEEFEVVYVPGHSQSDILLWNRETGEALAGDLLIKTFTVNPFIEPPYPGEKMRPKPLLQYRNSLEKMSRLPLTMTYPGHGEPFGAHVTLINMRLGEQEKRCEQILEVLSNGEKCIFDISKEVYPRLRNQSIFLGLSQIQGHLDLLELRDEVASEKRGSIVWYHQMKK